MVKISPAASEKLPVSTLDEPFWAQKGSPPARITPGRDKTVGVCVNGATRQPKKKRDSCNYQRTKNQPNRNKKRKILGYKTLSTPPRAHTCGADEGALALIDGHRLTAGGCSAEGKTACCGLDLEEGQKPEGQETQQVSSQHSNKKFQVAKERHQLLKTLINCHTSEYPAIVY